MKSEGFYIFDMAYHYIFIQSVSSDTGDLLELKVKENLPFSHLFNKMLIDVLG